MKQQKMGYNGNVSNHLPVKSPGTFVANAILSTVRVVCCKSPWPLQVHLFLLVSSESLLFCSSESLHFLCQLDIA